jgi:glycosyltransferase involved in cell wall biosynthesis
LTVSDEVADDYCRTAGNARSRCTTIYNGLDADAFRASAAPRDTARAALGLAPGDLAVVTVGRLQPQKAHEHLIGAAQLVAARHPDLPLRYFVVGEGPRRAELEALAAASGLAGCMHFLGARRDVPSLLAAADLCCLTSRYEGFSNVVLECLIMGVPVVATDAGGVREALEDGRSGFIVPVGDVAALADRIANLSRDEGLRRAMGQAARARGADFTIDANVQATAALYRRLLAQKEPIHAH